MSVLDRGALQDSPLADLHAIASELSLDGYRRLRKADLIDAILARQGGEAPAEDAGEAPAEGAAEATPEPAAATGAEEESTATRRRRGRRGGRGRRSGADESRPDGDTEAAPAASADTAKDESAGGAGTAAEEETIVEGAVELLAGGSGFVRVSPPESSDDDVYISAAQVKRCELVSGDRVSGPKRAPRRSERFASLVRVDTINGQPAAEVLDGVRFDELPAAFPTDRFTLSSDDATLKAIEWLTPIGRGSRVTVVGAARAGKSHVLRELARALAADAGLSVFVALAGVRPEEISEWGEQPTAPAAAVSFAASTDAQDHAAELVVEQAKRVAARGADAVVLIDTLDGLHPASARKALAAARNIRDGGSLTVIATASAPLGGETTVIALDVALTSTGRLPALDLVASGTTRPELLVGAAGAEAIADASGAARGTRPQARASRPRTPSRADLPQ